MRVLVFGITGYTGRHLAAELLARGHEVVGASREVSGHGLPPEVDVVAGDVFDAGSVARLARGAEAIVVAVAPLDDEERSLLDALPGLLDAAAGADARLGYVGGASSLRRSEDGPRIFDDGLPEEWKPTARIHIDVLDALRASDTEVDWFFLSPAEQFGAHDPGERRGSYRTGLEVAVADADGVSRIGGEDFALALVDELERPRHHRVRFTVGY